MKQIVDKLNKIAKKIDENVDIPNTDLITDSLDAITTALGGTPNDSNLIVDKLEDIAGVAHGGGGGGVTNPVIEITLINNTGSTITPYLYINHENEVVSVRYAIENGETKVVDSIVIPESDTGPEGPYFYKASVYAEGTITASNEVNCTYNDYTITITDETQSSSITLTFA